VKLPMFVDSAGVRSFTMTASALTLGAVLVKFLVANLHIGAWQFGPPPDAGLVIALLGPTLTSYVARRNDILTPAASIAARKDSPT
jgi:hypothetical protein